MDDDAAHPNGARTLLDVPASEAPPPARCTPEGADPDSALDVRAGLRRDHRALDVGALPPVLLPRRGGPGPDDHEEAVCPDRSGGDVVELRGIDRERGWVVLIRPDQHVAHGLPLDAHAELDGGAGRRRQRPGGRRGVHRLPRRGHGAAPRDRWGQLYRATKLASIRPGSVTTAGARRATSASRSAGG